MINWLTALIGVTLGLIIIRCVRKDYLAARHGAVWSILALSLIVVGIFPSLIDIVAVRLGVSYPPTLILIMAFAALLLKALLSDIELSKAEVRILRLAQKVAILEATTRDDGRSD